MEAKNSKIIYLHGSESNSRSGKARQFAEKFPGMLTPDFTGTFEERMKQLSPILGTEKDWTIIGSSYGGLMAAAFTLDHPDQVRKLILLAPALTLDEFAARLDPSTSSRETRSDFAGQRLRPVPVPTIIVHGTEDDVVPLKPVRALAEKVFPNITYFIVEDGHRLHKAFEELDWEKILE